MKPLLFFAPFAFVPVVCCPGARADSVPYTHAGTVAPQSMLYAASTGEVYGYFVQGGPKSGGTEEDTDSVYVYDVTTGVLSNAYFDSQTTTPGTMAAFGSVNQGDTLIVGLYDQTTGSVGASEAQYSSDGLNHAYMTSFAGGTLNGASLPAGVYVGMEDRMQGQQWDDFNYRDDTFVLTNVTQTPEPESWALLATGIVGGAGLLGRRVRWSNRV